MLIPSLLPLRMKKNTTPRGARLRPDPQHCTPPDHPRSPGVLADLPAPPSLPSLGCAVGMESSSALLPALGGPAALLQLHQG